MLIGIVFSVLLEVVGNIWPFPEGSRNVWIDCTLYACLFNYVLYWKRKLDHLNNWIRDSNPHKHGCVSAFFCVGVILCRPYDGPITCPKNFTNFVKDT
jgi:hypothetical protein